MSSKPLTEDKANAIYDVLVSAAGARESWRSMFIANQTSDVCDEWRFQGDYGFGGKFWRNITKRPDDTWGECWYINAYTESYTEELEEREVLINSTLEILRKYFEGVDNTEEPAKVSV